VAQEEGQRIPINAPAPVRVFTKCAELGAKEQRVSHTGVVERLLAQAIANQRQGPRRAIEDRKRKHTVERPYRIRKAGAFDLGEHHKVAILSVTEGEDKPLKYPDMFRAADVMLLNKCDLLPYLEFDADLAEANARRVNPHLTIFRVSATSGDGLAAWVSWIEAGLEAQRAKHGQTVDALKRRVAELERQLAAR
jgi:hypothetical protein